MAVSSRYGSRTCDIQGCLSNLNMQCRGSGSNRISGSGALSNLTKYKAKLYFFPENFNILSKMQKILTPMTLTRKVKQFMPALL
jgi:hypothetical protein